MAADNDLEDMNRRRITGPLFEEIASWAPTSGRAVRPREQDRITDNLDAAIQEWLKHQNRCELVVWHTVTGYPLTSTRRPWPTSRPVPLATAVQVSLCEALAGIIADELLAMIRPILTDGSYSRLHDHATTMLLEFLPFDGTLELILESVPAIHQVLFAMRLFEEDCEVQEPSNILQMHCRRRARTKLRIKSGRGKSEIEWRVEIDEVFGHDDFKSVTPPHIWAFLIRLLEWLNSISL